MTSVAELSVTTRDLVRSESNAMTRTSRVRLAGVPLLLLAVSAAVAGCGREHPIDSNTTCPCAPGWICEPTAKICVPEEGELSLELPVGNATKDRAEFDAWRRKLPQPLASIECGHLCCLEVL